MTIWRVGMKAVCIKRSVWLHPDGTPCCHNSYPSYGEVCQVTGVYQDTKGVWLEVHGYWSHFRADRFRPVTERKSKNKHFEVLRDLLKNPHKVLEEA